MLEIRGVVRIFVNQNTAIRMPVRKTTRVTLQLFMRYNSKSHEEVKKKGCQQSLLPENPPASEGETKQDAQGSADKDDDERLTDGGIECAQRRSRPIYSE